MNSRQSIIRLLLAHGALSRADLAQATRLSKPTVSSVVADLIAEGAVREVGFGASKGGRRPVLLRLGGDGKLAVGMEVDARVCTVALVNLDGEVFQQVELPLTDTRVEAVVATLVDGVARCFAGRDRTALIGCGVAVPGLVDTAADTVRYATSLGWTAAPLRALLAAQLRVPVMITDRGKAAALGELWFRGREQHGDLVYLYLGKGVGGAIVLGNALHLGRNQTAGEIGHMSIDPDGPPCKCGNRGCLETFVAEPAIVARAQAWIAAGCMTLLASLADARPEAITTALIAQAARAGDALALELIRQTAAYVGMAIANLVNLLNPEAIILGGPASRWGDLFLAAVRQEAEQRALTVPWRAVRIMPSQAGAVAVPLGAAALVLQQAGDLLAYPSVAEGVRRPS